MQLVTALGKIQEKEAALKLEIAKRNLTEPTPNDPTKSISADISKLKKVYAQLSELSLIHISEPTRPY